MASPHPSAGHVAAAAKYSKMAAEGAAKIKDYSEAALKLRDEGKSLSELQTIAADLKYVSKISAGLQAVSVGFAVLSAFLPVPTIEDQILDGVKANLKAIKTVAATLDKDVAHLTRHDDISNQNDTLTTETSILRSKTEQFQILAVHPGNKSAIASIEELEATPLENAFDMLESIADGTLPGRNLLQVIYEDSYGELRLMQPVLSMILEHVDMFVILRTKFQAKHDGATDDASRLAAAQSVATDFGARIDKVHARVAYWLDRCIDAEQNKKQITAYFKTELSPDLDIDKKQASTDMLVEKLTEKYPYLAVSALITKHRSGFSWHLFHHHHHHSIVELGWPEDDTTDADKKMDFMITWRPRYPGLHAPQRISSRKSIEHTPTDKQSSTEIALQSASAMLNLRPRVDIPNGIKGEGKTKSFRAIFKSQVEMRAITMHGPSYHSYSYACIFLESPDDVAVTSGTHFAYSKGPRISFDQWFPDDSACYNTYWQFAFWL